MDAQTRDYILARAYEVAQTLPPLDDHQRSVIRRCLATPVSAPLTNHQRDVLHRGRHAVEVPS